MNDLLFYALLIALLYYFFIYLPNKKKLTANPPLKHSQGTQTEPYQIDNPELVELKEKLSFYLDNIKVKEQIIEDYKKLENKLKTNITKLQTQIRELVKKPSKPTNSKSTQTDSEADLTNTLDNLIKNIQDFNRELD
jgi:hypothetical protein